MRNGKIKWFYVYANQLTVIVLMLKYFLKKEETIKSSSFKVKCPIQCKINNENNCAKMKNVV